MGTTVGICSGTMHIKPVKPIDEEGSTKWTTPRANTIDIKSTFGATTDDPDAILNDDANAPKHFVATTSTAPSDHTLCLW